MIVDLGSKAKPNGNRVRNVDVPGVRFVQGPCFARLYVPWSVLTYFVLQIISICSHPYVAGTIVVQVA